MALTHVVHQVLQTLGNALTLGFHSFFLRLGIEGQEVAGRTGGKPLLHRKAHAGAGFFVTLDRFSQAHECLRVQQVTGG